MPGYTSHVFTFILGLTGLTLLGDLGRTKMLKRLSELGVLLYHQDPDGQAAIHRAVRNVNAKTMEIHCGQFYS